MTPPAVIDAGPVPSTTNPTVVEGLRAELQALQHTIRHALPALGYVADDPCEPAQRVLLGEVIDDLRAALNGSGAQT